MQYSIFWIICQAYAKKIYYSTRNLSELHLSHSERVLVPLLFKETEIGECLLKHGGGSHCMNILPYSCGTCQDHRAKKAEIVTFTTHFCSINSAIFNKSIFPLSFYESSEVSARTAHFQRCVLFLRSRKGAGTFYTFRKYAGERREEARICGTGDPEKKFVILFEKILAIAPKYAILNVIFHGGVQCNMFFWG